MIDAATRARIGKICAEAVARIGYLGVGTIEFLYEDGEFFFIEMNTRLQVEHPVTEAITGVDLVREQIRIAAGLPLSFTQDDIVPNGHAIECRINAENLPDFHPSPGRIRTYYAPGGLGVRMDSALYDGYAIPPYYDSLIGKLIVHGRTRELALARLRRALSELIVDGIDTTIPLFQALLDEPDIHAGRLQHPLAGALALAREAVNAIPMKRRRPAESPRPCSCRPTPAASSRWPTRATTHGSSWSIPSGAASCRSTASTSRAGWPAPCAPTRFEVRVDTRLRRRVLAALRRADRDLDQPPIERLYRDLHRLGHAHSVESWPDGELVGGLYGVSLGGAFFGESMFSPPARRLEGGAGRPGRAAARRRLPPARHPVHDRPPGAVRRGRDRARRLPPAARAGGQPAGGLPAAPRRHRPGDAARARPTRGLRLLQAHRHHPGEDRERRHRTPGRQRLAQDDHRDHSGE